MIRNCAVAIATLMLAGPALAQEPPTLRPSITVMGEGRVETAPDAFRMVADLQGRGPDQVSALRALADAQARVSDVQRLEGLQKARLTTAAPSVTPTFDPACGEGRYGGPSEDCPIVGYRAVMSLSLEAGPISQAGNAVSFASERGATNARVESFFLTDDASQTAAAQAAAFADARRQAESLASAAGQRIRRVLTLRDPTATHGPATYGYGNLEDVVVTASRARQTVSLRVAPPPVQTTARVQATFEIE